MTRDELKKQVVKVKELDIEDLLQLEQEYLPYSSVMSMMDELEDSITELKEILDKPLPDLERVGSIVLELGTVLY